MMLGYGAAETWPENAIGVVGRTDISAVAERSVDALIGQRSTIGLAVSGGSDSMALMTLLARWGKHRGVSVRVATVDHSVQPGSASVAARVNDAARHMGLHCDVLTRKYDGSSASQARLRRDRYGLLCDWGKAHRLDTVAVAHTEDDALETLWMRLDARSHWYGLAAPFPAAPAPVWPQGAGIRLIRPLLTVRRSELRTWLTASGVGWHDDPANADPRYQRVRMRARAARLGEADRSLWIGLWWRLARARARTMRQIGALCQRSVVWRKDGSAGCDRSLLIGLPRQTAVALLGVVIQCVSGRERAAAFSTCNALRERIIGSRVPFFATLGGAWLRVGKQLVEIAPAPQKRARTPGAPVVAPVRILPGAERIWSGRFAITLEGAGSGIVFNRDSAAGRRYTDADLDTDAPVSPMARRSLPVLIGKGVLTARAVHSTRAHALLADPMVGEIQGEIQG